MSWHKTGILPKQHDRFKRIRYVIAAKTKDSGWVFFDEVAECTVVELHHFSGFSEGMPVEGGKYYITVAEYTVRKLRGDFANIIGHGI